VLSGGRILNTKRDLPALIDNAKMLRNFVQIMRSGAVGRKSLGSAPKRLVREWLDARDPAALFKANVGRDPSLTDIVKMVHPSQRMLSATRCSATSSVAIMRPMRCRRWCAPSKRLRRAEPARKGTFLMFRFRC